MPPLFVIVIVNVVQLKLIVATKNINNLVHIHLLHVLASGFQILTRIEVARILIEVLADSSSHSQTSVRVDVDFATCALRSLPQLLLGDTYSIGQLTAVSVDGINLLLRN